MRQICFFGKMVMVMMCLIMPSYGQKVNEGKEKRSDYTRTKELNDLVRQWIKEGWKVHGSTRTLKGALQHHYDRMLENSNLMERIGTATDCKSTTVCRLAALNSASMDYALSVASEVYGIFETDLLINEGGDEEQNKFKVEFMGKLGGRIRGLLEESFALIKTKDGKNQYMIFFLLDREIAREAQMEVISDSILYKK